VHQLLIEQVLQKLQGIGLDDLRRRVVLFAYRRYQLTDAAGSVTELPDAPALLVQRVILATVEPSQDLLAFNLVGKNLLLAAQSVA